MGRGQESCGFATAFLPGKSLLAHAGPAQPLQRLDSLRLRGGGRGREAAAEATMSLQSGAAVAVVAALGANLGKVCQKRGTENLPVLEMKAEVVKLYLRSPWWLAGLLLDVGGAILTLAALALAPVSVVQPILGCGLACVAIFSHYLTADRLRASDWAACLLCVAGTIGIGLTTVEGSGAEEMLLASGVIIIATFGALATACSALAERKQLSLEIAASVSAG